MLEDIADIRINADIIDEFENIEIVSDSDDSVVIPEHMVNYVVKVNEKKVYILSINPRGIEQKLNGYRSS